MTNTVEAHNKVRWQCRRGMLELELLLSPFAEEKYAQLNTNQQRQFQKLLNYPDTTLYALLNGSESTACADENTLLQMIFESRKT